MRIKESGIGTTVLVVIVVAVVIGTVIPVTVVAVLLGGGGSPGGLPVYAGASAMSSSTQGNITSTLYDISSAGLADVYNWYKAEMPNQGWTLTGDNPTSTMLTLSYSNTSGATATITIMSATVQGSSATKLLELSYTCGTASQVPC